MGEVVREEQVVTMVPARDSLARREDGAQVEDNIQTPERLVEAVYQRLLVRIQSGALSPNARLHQGNLAEQFGVSRTPVREALLRLEQDGLVQTVSRVGMFVRPLGIEDARQSYELRELLEPWAARRACLRATDEERASLAAIQQEHEFQEQHQHSFPSFDSNRDFHLRLVHGCGNEVALGLLRRLWAQAPMNQIYTVYRNQSNARKSLVHGHGHIVDAFVAGDADKVEQLVREHIRESLVITEEGIDSTSASPESR